MADVFEFESTIYSFLESKNDDLKLSAVKVSQRF
jgi:hypothetical protein